MTGRHQALLRFAAPIPGAFVELAGCSSGSAPTGAAHGPTANPGQPAAFGRGLHAEGAARNNALGDVAGLVVAIGSIDEADAAAAVGTKGTNRPVGRSPFVDRRGRTIAGPEGRAELAALRTFDAVADSAWVTFRGWDEAQVTWLTRVDGGWYESVQQSADAYPVLTDGPRSVDAGDRAALEAASSALQAASARAGVTLRAS